MRHLPDGTLQAFVDGELRGTELDSVERHLSACPACREKVEAIRRRSQLFHDAVDRLDAPLPPARPLGDPVPLREDHAHGLAAATRTAAETAAAAGPGLRRILLRAAVLLLATAGVASAVIPGSPVREWLVELAPDAPEEPAPARLEEEPERAREPSEVSVRPADGRVHVALRGFPAATAVHVSLHDSAEARVEVTGSGVRARYTIGPGRIDVTGDGEPARVRIRLPREVERASITVDGRLAVLKSGDQFELLRPAVDSLAGGVTFRLGS